MENRAELKPTRRKTWLALVLSLLVPGWGHLYSGRLKWGIVALSVVFITGMLGEIGVTSPTVAWFGLAMVGVELSLWFLFVPIHAAIITHKSEAEGKSSFPKWYIYLAFAVIAYAVFPMVYSLCGSWKTYHMPAASMENLLFVDDYLYADQDAYESSSPERGDVVVFIYPGDGVTKYLKRIVGLPGDTIEVVDKKVFINGDPEIVPPSVKYVDTTTSGEQNIRQRRPGGLYSRDNFGPYVVPENSFFVLADNRDNSADSRFWGPVNRELLVAKASHIYWSSDLSRVGLRIK